MVIATMLEVSKKKSIIKYCSFIHKSIIPQYGKKQKTISTLLTKIEYIRFGHKAQKTIWLQHFFNKL